MPSCHTAIRTLCRNHTLPLRFRQQQRCRPQWQLKYSTSVSDSRRDDTIKKESGDADTAYLDSLLDSGDDIGRTGKSAETNLNQVTADSAYLDFLLGSQDDGPAVNTRTLGDDLEYALEERTSSPSRNVKRDLKTGTGASEHTSRGRRARIAKLGHVQQQEPITNVAAKAKPAFQYAVHQSNPVQPGTVRRAKPGAVVLRSIMPRRPNIVTRRVRVREATLFPSWAKGWRRLFPTKLFKDWTVNVIMLCREISSGESSRHNGTILPVLPPGTMDLVEWVYTALETEFDTNVHYLLGSYKDWSYVTLWFLHYDPSTALDVLLAKDSLNRAPRSQLLLALKCLATQYSHGNNQGSLKRLAEALPKFIRPGGMASQPQPLTAFLYRVAARHLTDEALSDVYRNLKASSHTKVGPRTWLEFASSFTERHKGDQALDALLEVKNAGGDVDEIYFRKICSILLRRAASMPGGLRACIRIVDTLVKIGVTLNNNLTNIIMLNAVEAGDLKTAMDIYHSMRDHGLQPDKYTFAILLKACKSSIDDAELLNETIRAAIGGIDILEAPIVTTEILHCLALHHTKHHSDNAFETVADAYAQLYSLAPLRLVGLLPEKLSHIDNQEGQKRPQPRPQDIYILLATFLEQSFASNHTVTQAYETWQRFKHAIESGQEPFASMVTTDHIFNAFLCTFIKTKKGLLHAAEVVKYMQLPQDSGTKYTRIRPTVQTWSIFVSGFTRHGQMHLAEQLLTYMKNKGIQPNVVTYNTLIGGYAKNQDMEGVMDSVKRLETDGFTWDRWTLGNLHRFRDQGKLEAEMRREKSLDFTEDLKQNLETRIEAFSPEVEVKIRKVVDEGDVQSAESQEGEQEKIDEAYHTEGGTEDANKPF